MAHLTVHRTVDAEGLERLRQPIDDVILEKSESPDLFVAAAGPVERYERRLTVTEAGDQFAVTESIDFRLAVPIWRPAFNPLVKRRLKHRPERAAWWAPPDQIDPTSARVLAYLAIVAIIAGYLGSILSQTLSFAGEEFSVDSSGQAANAAIIRIGTPIAFGVMWLADRRGRRLLLLSTGVVGCLLAATTAISPGMWAYTSSQTLARGLSTALSLLVVVVAAEESPNHSRAFVVSILSLCGGLGSGMVVWAVPLAGTGIGGWRWIPALAMLGIIPLVIMWRHLPETRRFTSAQLRLEVADPPAIDHKPIDRKPIDRKPIDRRVAPAAGLASQRNRLLLLGGTAMLFALFAAPGSTLNTDYLREVHDFSADRVTIFKLVTSTPIGIGVVAAGWLADRRGRKIIGAIGITLGTLFTVVEYNTSGSVLWISAIIGTVVGGAVVPTLGVYGPELFGTLRRGRNNAIVTLAGVVGSVSGLLAASWLLDRTDYGNTFMFLGVGPLIVAGLLLFVFPETAKKSLEDINPEDRQQDTDLQENPRV